MKIKNCTVGLLAIIVIYLLFSFVAAEIDCLLWSNGTRFWFVVGVLFICVAVNNVK